MDLINLSELYLNKQERFYGKTIAPFSKHLVKQFAKYIDETAKREEGKATPLQHSPIELPAIRNKVQPRTKLQVALITEDIGHLTGGRYYCWFIASALVELGYEVVVYTNQKPVFGNEFSKYKQPEIRVVVDKAKKLETIDVPADIYIGSPISGNIAASRLGKAYGKPSFALIFDPFPLMEQYLGSQRFMGWEPLLAQLRSTNTQIINLCNTTTPYCTDWLNKRLEQIHPIYPCINSRELVQTPAQREDYVVFVSRLVKHKNFPHVLKACKNLGIKLKVISSVDGINAWRMVKELGMKKQVDFHMKISDAEKFEIIKRARVLVNASKFEGFGMWLIEAIACGTPTVCYEYPTLHEIQDYAGVDNVYYADWDNPVSFETQLKKAYDEQKYSEPTRIFDFEAMQQQVKKVFTIEPKIGVITIGLNEEQFIGASLRSSIRHPNIAKVAVVEGSVNLYKHAATDEGLSKDNTRKEVLKVIGEKNGDKIVYERYGWAVDKSELRNRALLLLGKDITHVLVIDADEVYKQSDLDNLVQAMRDNPLTGVFLYPFYHFWKQKNLIATGGQWDSQMFRCFRYGDKSLKWKLHNAPVVNKYGQFINVAEGQMNLDNVHVNHYSYMKDGQNIKDKLLYYKLRDGNMLNVQDTWTNWKKGDPTQPTHGGGTTAEFTGTHPDEVKGIL